MLDNAHEHGLIAFAWRDSLRESLEHYITMPSDCGFKVVFDEANDSRLQYLRKLDQVLHKLGSNGCLVYHPCSIPDQKHLNSLLVMKGQELMKYLPEEPTEYMRLHLKLGKIPEAKPAYSNGNEKCIGGSLAGMVLDLDQARKMLNMRIKIDVWS